MRSSITVFNIPKAVRIADDPCAEKRRVVNESRLRTKHRKVPDGHDATHERFI